MKRLLIAIVVLCCSFYAIAAGPNQIVPLRISSPKTEIAELEKLIADAKASGETPNPLWTQRIQELVPQVKGHPGNVTYDLSSFQVNGGFAPGAVIRPEQLTPLDRQIQDLEFQISGTTSNIAPDAVTFANLKAQLNVLYAQRAEHSHRNPLDQGNDACSGTYVDGIPFTDSGTTIGMANNYNPITSCNFSNAPDVVYEFSPLTTQIYNISLEGSSYDCYLHVNTGGGCPGSTQVGCNDDWFGLQSFLSLTLNAGELYYIIVDGYDINAGDYVLTITDNCSVECQLGDVTECPEVFGATGWDDCNGACNNGNGIPTWQNINLGETICGRGYAINGGRDTDSYRFTLAEACSLRITLNSEFPTQLLVINDGCPWVDFPFFTQWAYTCSTVTYITSCLAAGSYDLWVGPNTFLGIAEFREYRVQLEPIPCSGCRYDDFVQAPGSASWNTCGAGNDNSLRGSEDYTYLVSIPYESDWTFSTCNDDSIWDEVMYLTSVCNDGIISADDDGCGGVGLSVINCVHLTAGSYYLTIEGYNDWDCGPFVLNISECAGSCCYGDAGAQSCDFVSLTQCNTLGGLFTYQEPCSSGACYARPICGEATQFSQLPTLPDEGWGGFLSHEDFGQVVFDNYSATDAVGSIRFWGFPLYCTGSPETFHIIFSSGSSSCDYTVTTTGTQLAPVYGGVYQLTEYAVYLDPPCGIPSGDISIAKIGDPDCEWFWSVSLPADGGPWGDFAFCLGLPCIAADSVTCERYSDMSLTDAYTLRWYQPAGYVRLWYSTDPNAVFPATYSSLASGYISPAGTYSYSFYSPVPGSPEMVFVVTMDCASALRAPDGDTPIQRLTGPFDLPTPVQR
ncbi:MAG: hypothetical protein IPP40_13285 [bacterium]|nr:hypothetical protein [bacterium]